ncbi:PTS lactose/cellobiose transporter subunit IIA, partial [Enterobacter intestinihominis]
DFDEAEKAMEESREYVKHAHSIQTELIGLDEGTRKLPVYLITVHTQDHPVSYKQIRPHETK